MIERQSSPRFAFRSNAYAWAVVAILCFGNVTSMLERQVINLLVEPIKTDLQISDTQISLLQGFAFAIFYALMALPIGRIVDARKRVSVIIWGTLVFSLATFSCGLATSFLMLFAARMFVGFGESTLTPSGMSLLGDYFPPEKLGRAVGLIVGSTYAGSGLALIIIGAVLGWLGRHPDIVPPFIGTAHQWQMAFMLAAIPGLLFAALMLLVREPPRSSASGEAVGQAVPLSATFRMIGANLPTVLPLLLGIPLLAAANFAMNAWVPTFFIRTYHWQAGEIGPIFGLLVILCGTGGTVSGGILADWLTKRGLAKARLVVPVVTGLLAVPFVIAFPLAGEAKLSLILMVPAMFFGAMPFGAGSAEIVSFAPNRMRGQIFAIYMLFSTLIGTGGGPWAIAAWTDLVLHDPLAIRWSIATVASGLFVSGVAMIALGLRSPPATAPNAN